MTLASVIALAVLAAAVAAVFYVRFRVLATCPRCGGWGAPLLLDRDPCWVCGGSGSVRVDDELPQKWAESREARERIGASRR